MADGDLTVGVEPVTTPLVPAGGSQLGDLGETFNVMLEKARGGLFAYEATRRGIAEMILSISETAGRVAGASEQMTSTTFETGAAIENIARLSATVAEGAGRQIDSIEAAQAINLEAENLATRARELAEQGRGFAVVADEVRRLAESSNETVRETEAAFHTLSGSITSVSSCIERMSVATGEVVVIAREAGDATADVSAATQQSSAATQQISASSNDLAELAGSLQRLVGEFRA